MRTFFINIKIVILMLILLLFSEVVIGQSLSVFDIDASDFPKIKAKLFAFDAEGKHIQNLSDIDIEIKENGINRQVTLLTCPKIIEPIKISSVLTIDQSFSMQVRRLNLAKLSAIAWVMGMSLDSSECAVTAFDDMNMLIQDFTNDRSKLYNAINEINIANGTDYDAGFISEPAGALLIAEKGKYQKVVVFLTDGDATGNESAIIQKAKDIDAKIYCITIAMPCPDILRNIATQTGGKWFENVTSTNEAQQIYLDILRMEEYVTPCEIEWKSDFNCSQGLIDLEIKHRRNSAKTLLKYMTPTKSVARLKITPESVRFNKPVPGIKTDVNIIVTAENADFDIQNVITSNPSFSIYPTRAKLKKGESRELILSYLPVDSGYAYTKFEYVNDLCKAFSYASAGVSGGRAKKRTLKLIHPDGGEIFLAGSDTVITWEGVPPDEPVTIEYRAGDDEPWTLLTDSAKGLSYKFSVPYIESDKFLARISSGILNENECLACQQLWSNRNLDVEFYKNGDSIRHAVSAEEWQDAFDKKEGAWCYYNNDPAYGDVFGKLYNWYAAKDPRGLAPKGWKIPTDEDWRELENCLGGRNIAGGKLKSKGTIEGGDGLWRSPNLGATDEFEFSALPGGYRLIGGVFLYLGSYGYWLSSSESDDLNSWNRSMNFGNFSILTIGSNKGNGYSIRCVKDD